MTVEERRQPDYITKFYLTEHQLAIHKDMSGDVAVRPKVSFKNDAFLSRHGAQVSRQFLHFIKMHLLSPALYNLFSSG